MSRERFDIHQNITDRIVQAIEAGAGEWQMPWHRGSGGREPVNVASRKAYRGVNVLALWVDAQAHGYSSHIWGTYRQWADHGCQVRKGAKASHVVFYKELDIAADDPETGEPTTGTRLFARATPVFNADQAEGFEPPAPVILEPAAIIERADAFVARTNAKIVHGGAKACYIPSLDEVRMPMREAFTGSAMSNATECYYSTLFHELTHFTAPAGRCNRDLSGRFGSDAYAIEELVAELGAAYLCADLDITSEARPDHAQYLAGWLKVLKADKRAIFTAASKAAEAVRFLAGEG